MTTVEKLFVQIFERKNWIIEQVKQQADLYNQNLASKLLIDGIAPPSWLWNPNFDSQSSDPKELNKEELISKLLLPHPRPTFPYSSSYCSLYSKPAVTGDNGDSSDGSFMETRASEKYTDAGGRSKAVPKCYVNDTESSLNCVPELDSRVTSPQDQADGLFMETDASDKCIDAGNGLTTVPECCDNATECSLNRARVLDLNATSPQAQTDVRISNYYAVPDQSLARIQRSKSRQTALKLRNSAKATSKIRLSNENNPGISSSGIRTDTQTVDHANVLFELIKPSDVNRESCVLREEKEGNQSKENGTSSYFGRITRSRSSCKQHSGVNESLKAEKSVQIEKIDGGLLPESEEDLQHPNHVNGSFEPVNTFDVITESCVGIDSTEKPGALNEFPKLDGPCYSGKVSSPMCAQSTGKSMQQPDDANELPEFVKSSSEQIGRKRRSRTACSNEGISKARSGVRIQPIGELVQQLDDANELPEFNANELPEFIKSSSEFVGRKTRSQTARSNEGMPKASGGTCTQSIGNLKEQLNDVNDLAEVVKPSSKFTGRKTRSQTAYINEGILKPVNSSSIPRTTDTRSRADATKTYHLANLSDNKVIPVCPGTDAVNQEENNSTVLAIELVPYGPVEAQPLCSGSNVDGVNLRVGSEGLVSRLQSGSFMAVKPKQLDFYGMEENNLGNTSSPPFEKKRMDKSSDQICCTSSEPASSVDKETPHSSNKDILEQQSPVGQEMSPKEKEAWRRSNDGTVEKFVEDKRKKFGSNISQMMENIEGNSEVILPIQNSTVLHGADVVQSVHKSSDVGMDQVRCQSSKGYQSSLDPQAEEGGLGYEGRDKREAGSGEAGLFYGSVGATHGEDGNLSHLKPKSLQLANESSSSSAKGDSWPQFKRRKVEDHLADSFSASPSFRAQKLHTSQGGPRRRCLKTAENNSDAVLQYQALPFSQERDASPSNANMSFDVGIYQQTKCDSPNGIESSTMLQNEQAELGSEERDDDAEIPSTYKHKQMGPSLVPSLTKQAAQDSQGCSVEDVEIVDPTSHILDASYKHLLHLKNKVNGLNADDLTGNETTLLERKSCLIEEGLLSHNSIGSRHNGDLDLNGSELEAFVLDAQTENGGVDVAGNGSLFATTERASIVEEICRSAGIDTPFSHFSSKFNPPSTDYLYKSVPNGLLERVDLQNPLLGDEAFKHFRASYSGTDKNTAFTKASYSDCLPYSPARFGWNSKNLYSSPVGKLWERISSGSGSSEKRISFNPELTCFTIEEDPGIIEENENADEVAHKIQEGGPTETTEREPLSEITEACLYPSAPLSVEDKFQDRGSLDSISTEVSLAGTHNSAKRKLRNYCRDKGSTNETMEKQSFSVGRNRIQKVNKSLNNRFTKPKLSGKTSLKKGEQRFSEKVPTRNNIVSNITSFVPLVQQKQAAAVCTGKRDVKVRALEAAEAAKRLEEKRQNERKMKKEAMKVERARIGQENLRQRELDKKKKEEEQKKKDADKAARKRLREEEEKKEKGRKRNRIEEARRQVKVQEEKLHAGEVEKEKQCDEKDDKVKRGKESENQIGKSQQMEKTNGGDKILGKSETEVMTAGISTSDLREAGDLYSHSDNRKVLGTLDKSGETDDLGSKKSPEKSYEISPYQCSDDEEDEEDDIRTKKFIPSWASKNCVALVLSSQREIDPDVIFPRESFCSMDEVLVPRKLQPK